MSVAKFIGYEALESVLDAALEQAAAGKGKERHAQDKPFDEQPMQLISDLLDSDTGMAFQAAKKIQESMRMPFAQAERELLGAIVYTAGIIIRLRKKEKSRLQKITDQGSKFWEEKGFTTLEAPLQPYTIDKIPTLTGAGHSAITAELRVPAEPAMVPIEQYNALLEVVESQQRRLAEAA